MNDVSNINGVHLFPLKVSGEGFILTRDEDHLLRRFGQVEVRKFPNIVTTDFVIRAVADEIWAVITGGLGITLVDRRQDSPTQNQSLKIAIMSENSQGLLIPFGIAYSIKADEHSLALRVTTHSDGTHPEDQSLSPEALSEFTSQL